MTRAASRFSHRVSLAGIDRVGGSEAKRQMLLHRFAIPYLPQEIKKHHEPAEQRDRTRGLVIPLSSRPKEW